MERACPPIVSPYLRFSFSMRARAAPRPPPAARDRSPGVSLNRIRRSAVSRTAMAASAVARSPKAGRSDGRTGRAHGQFAWSREASPPPRPSAAVGDGRGPRPTKRRDFFRVLENMALGAAVFLFAGPEPGLFDLPDLELRKSSRCSGRVPRRRQLVPSADQAPAAPGRVPAVSVRRAPRPAYWSR